MKNNVRPFFYALLMITFLFDNAQQISGQEKVILTTGFGLPELLNVGVKYQFNQTQIGLSVGAAPQGSGEYLISISSDIYYHFGGFSELTNVRPWYGRIGVNYLHDKREYLIDKYFYLNTRIGRDLNISDKIGIQIDVGAIFQLHNETIITEPSSDGNMDLEFPVIPSFGIGFFYRI